MNLAMFPHDPGVAEGTTEWLVLWWGRALEWVVTPDHVLYAMEWRLAGVELLERLRDLAAD